MQPARRTVFAGLPASEDRRRDLERRRTVPDREIIARFPRLVVPTYLATRGWFASDEFRHHLPLRGLAGRVGAALRHLVDVTARRLDGGRGRGFAFPAALRFNAGTRA
jgi:hypothetical protein